jgi:A/G-specific adenine glycosylase
MPIPHRDSFPIPRRETTTPGVNEEPDRFARLRSALLAWYRRDHRRLPWRSEPTPWRVLVSELMLQQTRVETVVPYFERFVARFPRPADLAAAGEDEVLALWSGLGYYRRARSLRAAARRIVERHAGEVPGGADLLRELPGVGEYTVAAVGSIAFGLPLAVVDGNVERVLARVFALPGRRGDGALRREVGRLAGRLLDRKAAGDANQALMELGARVCTPRAPACLVCPLRGDCGSAAGDPERRPAPPRRREPEDVVRTALLLRRAGRILLVRRPDGGRMAGMLELPGVEGEPAGPVRIPPEPELVARPGERRTTVRHAVLHRRITQHVHDAELARGRRRRAADPWRWVRRGELTTLPLTGVTAKSLRAVGIDPKGVR